VELCHLQFISSLPVVKIKYTHYTIYLIYLLLTLAEVHYFHFWANSSSHWAIPWNEYESHIYSTYGTDTSDVSFATHTREKGRGAICESTGRFYSLILLALRRNSSKGVDRVKGDGRALSPLASWAKNAIITVYVREKVAIASLRALSSLCAIPRVSLAHFRQWHSLTSLPPWWMNQR
jgi:hypothetical protein